MDVGALAGSDVDAHSGAVGGRARQNDANRMRAEIRDLPKGEYEFEDWIENEMTRLD